MAMQPIDIKTAKRRSKPLPPPPRSPNRPAIRLGVDLHRTVDEASAALLADLNLYQRDGQLVHIVRLPEDAKDSKELAGTPQIRALALASLRERLTAVAYFEKFDGRSNDWVPCIPDDKVVQAVMSRGQWKGIRPIVGVIETPSLRPDGSVLQTPGYDEITGFVYAPAAEFPPVPERPTREDAEAALAALAEPLNEFPYPSSDHRSATIAAILTLISRPAIEGAVPGFVFDASTRGSGKTLQSDVVAIIATGRESAKMGYPPDDVELEKCLGAYAMKGSLLVNFDNVARGFGGGPLDRCLTATDTVELRVLGQSNIPTLKWRGCIVASGNNVEIVGDTARRVLVSRLEPTDENPEERSNFKIDDLRRWCLENRPRLVVAALTLLRAFVVARRPNMGVKKWGSFEAWSALVPPAIVWAGGADPMTTRPSIDAGAEPEKAALATLIAEWPRLAETYGRDNAITAKAAIQSLYPHKHLRDAAATPDGFDDLRDSIEVLTHCSGSRPPTPIQLSGALRKNKKRYVSGRCLSCRPGRSDVQVWYVNSVSTNSKAHQSTRHQTVTTDSGSNGGGVSGVGGVSTTELRENGTDILVEPGSNNPSKATNPPNSDAEPGFGDWLAGEGVTGVRESEPDREPGSDDCDDEPPDDSGD